MGLGFVVDDIAREVGSAGFLKGFFSTISYHLEPGGWGTKYPELMGRLYQGALDASDARKVLEDVREIRHALKSIRPVSIIWDIDVPDAKAPWGSAPIPEDKDLSTCFITSDGRNVFDVLVECLELLATQGGQMTIEPY
jgi:hypothetical protein